MIYKEMTLETFYQNKFFNVAKFFKVLHFLLGE